MSNNNTSEEASSCLLVFSINKTEPGGEGPQCWFWPWCQFGASVLHLSSGGRRLGPEKEERSDWRTHGETAEETDDEGGTAALS